MIALALGGKQTSIVNLLRIMI